LPRKWWPRISKQFNDFLLALDVWHLALGQTSEKRFIGHFDEWLKLFELLHERAQLSKSPNDAQRHAAGLWHEAPRMFHVLALMK
jgi:hypothetical protein